MTRTRNSLAKSLLGSVEGGKGGGVYGGGLDILWEHLGYHPGYHKYTLMPFFGSLDLAMLPLPPTLTSALSSPPPISAWQRRDQAPLKLEFNNPCDIEWCLTLSVLCPMVQEDIEAKLSHLMESPM